MKDIGVRKGDAVVVYLPMLLELPITMLACARIGAVHSVFLFAIAPLLSLFNQLTFLFFFQVVFAGFSAESLAQRIVDCKPKLVITCNAVKRGPKIIPLKDIVDSALVQSAKTGVSIGCNFSSFLIHLYLYLSNNFNVFLLPSIGLQVCQNNFLITNMIAYIKLDSTQKFALGISLAYLLSLYPHLLL